MKIKNKPRKLHLLVSWLDSGYIRLFQMIVHTVDDTVSLIEMTRGSSKQLFLKRIALPYYENGNNL